MSAITDWSCFIGAGEFINLAMYCERIRRKFWPEWFVDVDDLYYDGLSEEPDSPSQLPDLGLYSRSGSFLEQESTLSHHDTPSPDSDVTGHSLFDSDMDTECSDMEQLKWKPLPIDDASARAPPLLFSH